MHVTSVATHELAAAVTDSHAFLYTHDFFSLHLSPNISNPSILAHNRNRSHHPEHRRILQSYIANLKQSRPLIHPRRAPASDLEITEVMSSSANTLKPRAPRKTLPMRGWRSRLPSARQLWKSLKPWLPSGVKKPAPPVIFTRPGRALTSEQWQRALALANIRGNYQRPDEELIGLMNKKHFGAAGPIFTSSAHANASLITPTATHTADTDTEMSDTEMEEGIPTDTAAPHAQMWEGEQRGQDFIDKHKLSLNKVFGASSWTQKVNKDARLKLLKSDGYDIAPLLLKGVTSRQITDAVLAYIDVRNQRNAIPTPPVSNDSDSEGSENGPKDEFETSAETGEQDQQMSDTEEEPLQEVVQLVEQKRKHSHEDDSQSEWHAMMPHKGLHEVYKVEKAQQDATSYEGDADTSSCNCGASVHKKPRIMTVEETEKEMESEAVHLHKTRILRNIFQSSRASRSLLVPATITPEASSLEAPKPTFIPRPRNKPSHIIIPATPAPAKKPTGADVFIGSRAVSSMLDEIKIFSSIGPDDEDKFFIRDPSFSEDQEGDTLMNYNGPEPDEFRHYIALYTADDGSTVIEGDARSLKGLVTHLRCGEHTYGCFPKFGDILEGDEKMDVLYRTIRWSCGEDTEAKLEKIEGIFEVGMDEGGLSVRVGLVRDGKTALV
jgi:hypothetical protein